MISLNTVTSIQTAPEKPSRTYLLDIDSGRIVSTKINDIEAVQQFIRKVLITPRFGCIVYGNNYGSEIEAMLTANKWNNSSAKALLPKLIKNAVMIDSRINDVYDFRFEDGKDCVYVEFKADTIFGKTEIREVISLV